MNRNQLTLIILYWYAAISVGSFAVACISYLMPFRDILEYSIKIHIIHIRFYFMPALIIFLSVGYCLSIIYVSLGYIYSIYVRNSQQSPRENWPFFAFNSALFIWPFIIWRVVGLTFTIHYWLIVIPVYLLSLFVFHFLFYVGTPEKQIKNVFKS